MIPKTLLLSGVAGALLMAAPALAQDIPPAPQPGESQTEQPQSLTLQPGAVVRGSDGAELGRLEGVRDNAAGEQELTVRGVDGQLRGVPLGGLSQNGAEVSVAWTAAEFEAAPTLDAEAPETPETPPAPPQPDPSLPVEPSSPATPPTLPPTPDPTDPSEPDPVPPVDGPDA